MTISSTLTRNDYPGAGSVGPYVYGFKIFVETDLAVIKRTGTTETTLTYLTDYTVSGAGNAAGGSVTLITALKSGESLTIRRNLPITQPASIRNQGSYLPETIEDQLDRAVLIQQQQGDAIARSLKLPVSYDPTGRSTTLTPTAGSVVVGDGNGFTTAVIGTASGVTLPGNSRTVATLSAYLASNAVFNIEDYGADPSGILDAAPAINAAATAALAANGVVKARAGSIFNIASTVTFKTHVDMAGAQFNYTGTTTAVQVGATGTLTQLVTMRFPRVTQTLARPVGTWPRADVGIRIIGAIGCTFVYGGIDGFAKGVELVGEVNGCDYNTHYLGTFSNNQFAVYADGTGTVGHYCNENVWIGGRPRLDYTELTGANTLNTGQIGTRYVYLGAQTNNHRFIGVALEGHVAQYVVENRGTHHSFDRCRWETDATNQRFYLNGAGALYTRILGGYDANKLLFTYAGGAGSIEVQQQDGIRANTGAANGHIVLNNANGADTPSFMLVPDAFASAAVHATAYQVRFSEKSLRGKATADASDRVTLDFSAGTLDLITLKSGATNAGLGSGKPSMSAAGKFITVAASATFTITGAAYATFDMADSNSGHSAMIKTNGGAGTVVYQDAAVFSGTSGTASKINVYATGGNLVIQNNTAGTIALSGTIVQLV